MKGCALGLRVELLAVAKALNECPDEECSKI
jgi:hypothetical protein